MSTSRIELLAASLVAFGLVSGPIDAIAESQPTPPSEAESRPPGEGDGDGEFDGYSDRWTGAFVGFGAFGGPTWLGNSAAGGDAGWTVGVFGRMNQVLSLIDFALDYRFTAIDTAWKAEALQIDKHAVGAALAVHPFFLMNFGASRFWYMMAAIYLQAGVTWDVTAVDYPTASVAGSESDLGLHLGMGTDFPVTDPDAGGALWAGIMYRFNQTTVELEPFGGDNIAEHIAVMNLSYRHNGLIF